MAHVAHLLHNIQGHLLHSDVFFLSKHAVQENGLSSASVKVEYIDTSLQLDRGKELKVASGLLDIPLSEGHFTKIKVDLAVHIFCKAPPAIQCRVSQGQLPPEAETTGWFCQLVPPRYTLLLSRHPVVAISHFNDKNHRAAIKK